MMNQTLTKIHDDYARDREHVLELAALQPERFADPAFAAAFGRYVQSLDTLIDLFESLIAYRRPGSQSK